MATSKFAARVFSIGVRTQVPRRCLHTPRPSWPTLGTTGLRPLLVGALGLAGTYGAFKLYAHQGANGGKLRLWTDLLATVQAASKYPESQPSVFSQTKDHALYLVIHLKASADAKSCAKTVAQLQKLINEVCPPDLRDEDDEIWAGVGFGPNFYSKIGAKPKKNYVYPERKGELGSLPSTGGDIFIHAKSNTTSVLFELAQLVLARLPKDSVEKFEDTYSFVYRNGRDLSGFIDGTENAADEDDRQKIAVETETGGSYAIAMKWVHRMNVIGREKDDVMSKWVGRGRDDSTELKNKPQTSHVARMTGGTNFEQKKKFEIVRQSMPYGNLHDKAGLFFIAYAASPENFEYMLKRMVGQQDDKHSDDIMRLTDCVKGTYFYFPGVQELNKFA